MTTAPPADFPPIYVVSLARATQRRADISARLQAAGLQYEFADAVDGRDEKMRAAFLRERKMMVDDRIYRLTRGRPLSKSEIGCYLSHYQLWERVAAEQPECALIFEDDARWDDDFTRVVADIVLCKQRWGLCLLTDDKGKCAFRKLHPVGNGRHLGYPLKRTMALAGYLIKPRAAKNLCARLRNVREPVDIALCRHWEWDDMRLSVRPHPVRHDENETTIADRGETGAQRKIHHQLCGGIINTPEWCRRIFHYCTIRSAK